MDLVQLQADWREKHGRMEGIYEAIENDYTNLDPAKKDSIEGLTATTAEARIAELNALHDEIVELNAKLAPYQRAADAKRDIEEFAGTAVNAADAATRAAAAEGAARGSGGDGSAEAIRDAIFNGKEKFMSVGDSKYAVDNMGPWSKWVLSLGGLRKAPVDEMNPWTLDMQDRGMTAIDAVFSTTSFDPFVRRVDPVLQPRAFPSLTDYLNVVPWNKDQVKYMSEDAPTNPANSEGYLVAEGGLYVEVGRSFTEVTADVKKLGVFLPVTEEELADAPEGVRMAEFTVRTDAENALENQTLYGDNTGEALYGINKAIVADTTFAKGADENILDVLFKQINKVVDNAKTYPSLIILHPVKWLELSQIKLSTGEYLFPLQSNPRPNLRGIPIAQSFELTSTESFVGAFRRYHFLYDRQQLRTYREVRQAVKIPAGNGASDQYTIPTGTHHYVVQARLCNIVKRALGFTKGTGL